MIASAALTNKEEAAMRSTVVARVSFGLLFGLLFAAAAQAQLNPPYREYAAKFTCGKEVEEIDDVVAGVYASSINIHNPHAKITVGFVKKIVVALREGTNFLRPVILRGILKPDQADRVDCPFIVKILPAPVPYV